MITLERLCRLSVLTVVLFSLVFPASAADFWVSPTGDDGNTGARDAPLKTIAMAQRKARELRRVSADQPIGGIHIRVEDGVYALRSPLFFRVEDAGTPSSPTVIEAAPGARPVVSGGVPVTGWKRVSGRIKGLPATAQGHVWVAPAPQSSGSIVRFRQLWVGGRKAVRACEPNDGTMSHLLGWNRKKETADVPAALLRGVDKPEGLEMFVQQQWEIAILRVKGWTIEGDRARVTFEQPESRIEFEHPWPQPILKKDGGQGAFRLDNSIAFLDQPGEWYQAADGLVYYWPRQGENLATAHVVAPVLKTLVTIDGSLDHPVSDIHFRGINFAYTTWMRPSRKGHVPLQAGMPMVEAYKISPPGTPDKKGLENQAWLVRIPGGVMIENARGIRFDGCTFQHMAASGLDFVSGTRGDVVQGCLFNDIGGNGLQMGDFQTDGEETHVPYDPTDGRVVCANERIDDNLVRDCANEDWGCVGIGVGYARGVTIAHNEITDVSYTGISLGWGWTPTINCMRNNRVVANYVHRAATRLCDTAGIYTLSAQPGTVISDNVVDDIQMSPNVDRPHHWFYLYADEGSSDMIWRDNWCPKAKILKNANGPGNEWIDNGPQVSAKIKAAAGLERGYRNLWSLVDKD